MRVGLDARRDTDEDAPNTGLGCALDLVEGIDDDEGGLRPGRRGQLLVALVVAVHDEPLSRDASPQGELELAERRDVSADAFVREQPEYRRVRKRLDAVDEKRVGRSGPVGVNRAQDRRLVVDDERGPVLGSKVREADPAD